MNDLVLLCFQHDKRRARNSFRFGAGDTRSLSVLMQQGPVAELRRVTTKEILSKLWDEDMDQETRHNFEQLASNLTEMNPAYVQLVVDGVNGTESSSKSERSSAANRYLVTWPPPGYTGPISLWITQSDLPTARPVEPWIVKNGYACLPSQSA